jgi:SAM-dependent methyltransferase
VNAVPERLEQGASLEPKAPDWDAVVDLWSDMPRQALWRRHSDEVNSGLVRRWLPEGVGTLLKTDLWDEAIGVGLYPELAARAQRVVGIDVSRHVVDAARRRYPALTATAAEVQALPLETASVDAVVSNSTLDHFAAHDEIDASLRELSRVLRPGGTLVLSLDNPLNPLVALSKALPQRRLNRAWLRLGRQSAKLGFLPYHVGVTYARRPLLRALDAAGFEIADTTTLVHSPRILAVVVGTVLERHAGAEVQGRFPRLLAATESLAALPTRYLTAHFFAVRAVRR